MNKKRLFSKIAAIVFSAAALVCFFLPCIMLDLVIDINTGVTSTSKIQRVSDGISPFMAVKALLADDEQLAAAEEKYQAKANELNAQKNRGEITQEEYEARVASSAEKAEFLSMYFMQKENWFSKNNEGVIITQDFVNEMHILAYASIAVFAVALVLLVFNILKLFVDIKAIKVIAGIFSVFTFILSIAFFFVPFLFNLSSTITAGQMFSRTAYVAGPHYYVAALILVNLLVMIFTLISIRKTKAERAEKRAEKRAAKAA